MLNDPRIWGTHLKRREVVMPSVRFETKECVRVCKDYVIGREITSVLKIAVDNITLELYDSHDYFAPYS